MPDSRAVTLTIKIDVSAIRDAIQRLVRAIMGDAHFARLRGERFCGIGTHDELTGRCPDCRAEL
jgi:hypothetical protein